jgi:ABC-2 type transport system permease protein
MTLAFTSSAHVTSRYLRMFMRQPAFVAITLLQPVIWLLLFGHVFQRVVEIPGFNGTNYIGFLTPGVVIMTALFSNGWSGMGYVEDIDRGLLDRFLVSPVPRGSLIVGQLTYAAVTTIIQSVIILGLGFVSGASFQGGLPGLLLCLAAALLLGTAFASFSNAVALLLRSRESVIGLSSFLVLPLSFLSATFLPLSLLPSWIQVVARLNPVNWAVQLSREVLAAQPDWSYVGIHLAGLAALGVVCAWLSTRSFRAYQRAI